jgi:hypothetical protein
MKSASLDELGYHTWRDVGGILGLIMDGVFCVFVVLAALCMMALATVILVLDYLVSPVLKLVSGSPRD